jgi:citrate synthase
MSWKTGITKIEPNRITIRGYRQEQLIGTVPFSRTIFLLWQARLPTEAEGTMFDALLTACVDHGVTPPSCLATRIAASVRASLPTAVAAGIMSITDVHGGAIEECAKLLQQWVQKAKAENKPIEATAPALLSELALKNALMPGYGHRLHTQDPRTERLFALAQELGIAGDHTKLARAIEAEFAKTKKLPINVDGAIGAIICDMGFDYRLGKAFFLMGRTAGLVAHAYEELTREKPMRPLTQGDVEYDGPWERDIEK